MIEEPVEVSAVAAPEALPVDLRSALRAAHHDREAATSERDQVIAALEKARSELQRLTDTQRDRELAHEAEVTKFVQARAAALLDGTESEIAWPASSDDTELVGEIAAAQAVEEQLAVKLREAERELRRIESRVRSAAVHLIISRAEELADELALIEASARDRRSSLSALAGLWVDDDGGRGPRPLQIGPRCHWALTDGDPTVPEAIIGLRRQRAAQRGIVMAPELPPPDWNAILAALLLDPEAEVP